MSNGPSSETMQISPSEVVSDPSVSWSVRNGRVEVELSYMCYACKGHGTATPDCVRRGCVDGRIREKLTPSGLRRRVGLDHYKRACDKLREAMTAGWNSGG